MRSPPPPTRLPPPVRRAPPPAKRAPRLPPVPRNVNDIDDAHMRRSAESAAKRMVIDFDLVRRTCAHHIERIATELLSEKPLKLGTELRFDSLDGKSAVLGGDQAISVEAGSGKMNGVFHDFKTNESGDIIQLAIYTGRAVDRIDAAGIVWEIATGNLSLPVYRKDTAAAQRREASSEELEAEAEAEKNIAKRIATAKTIWRYSQAPLPDSLFYRYIASRGIDPAWAERRLVRPVGAFPLVRFARRYHRSRTDSNHPAMVIPVCPEHPDGSTPIEDLLVQVQVTCLAPDGTKHEPIPQSGRIDHGVRDRGAAWLGQPSDSYVVTEGFDNAAAALQELPDEWSGMATLSSSTLGVIEPRKGIRRAIIFADNDGEKRRRNGGLFNPGVDSACQTAQAWRQAGIDARVFYGLKPKTDAVDLHKASPGAISWWLRELWPDWF